MATVTRQGRGRVLAALLGLLVLAGCAADAGAGSPDTDGAGSPDTDATGTEPGAAEPAAVGPRESHTPGGVRVVLSLDAEPVKAGPVQLDFTLDTPAIDPDVVTVDLVAPLMPAHGIVRFPVRAETDTRFVSEVEIPMEGLWEVYLNLDAGQEAAWFEIEVAPSQLETDLGTQESPRGHEGRGTQEGHLHGAHGTP